MAVAAPVKTKRQIKQIEWYCLSMYMGYKGVYGSWVTKMDWQKNVLSEARSRTESRNIGQNFELSFLLPHSKNEALRLFRLSNIKCFRKHRQEKRLDISEQNRIKQIRDGVEEGCEKQKITIYWKPWGRLSADRLNTEEMVRYLAVTFMMSIKKTKTQKNIMKIETVRKDPALIYNVYRKRFYEHKEGFYYRYVMQIKQYLLLSPCQYLL